MRVFISQPMAGRSNEELLAERARIARKLRTMYEDVEIIDSFLLEPRGPVWLLGESIKLMDGADLVYFCRGWQRSRGCMVEYMTAGSYGIDMIFERE